MAAETLGALALLDPAIKLGRKAWKTYKLQEYFGEDFKDYSNHFFSEGVVLDEILKTPIGLLEDHDTRSELSTAFGEVGSAQDLHNLLHQRPDEFKKARQILSTLAKLSKDFEECSKLIEKYVPPLDTPRPSIEASRTPSQGTATPVSTNDNHVPSSVSQPSLAVPEHSLPTTRLEGRKKKPFLRRILHLPTVHNVTTPVPTSADSGMPLSLAAADVQDQAAIEEAQGHAMQNAVAVRHRVWDWVLGDRERFKDLIRSIQDSNRLLERLLVITDIRKRSQNLASPTSATYIGGDRNGKVALHLALLGQVFGECSNSDQFSFTMELKDDYEEYAKSSISDNAYLKLTPESFLFPIKVYCDSPTTAITTTSSISSEVLIAICKDYENSQPCADTS